MKVYIKDKVAVPVFEPIELVITLEREKEIQELWHRLNVRNNVIGKAMVEEEMKEDKKYKFCFDADSMQLLQPLRFILRKCMQEREIIA